MAEVTLEGISPYSQGRFYRTEVPAEKRGTGTETESKHDYEVRTWRERCHANEEGRVFIPSMAFKNCLAEAAKYLSVQIQGKGKATYTKHFEAGVMVVEGLTLPVFKATVEGEWVFVPGNGRRGGSTRVMKCFPLIRKWSGKVTFHILDDVITPAVFEQHLREAGNFIGIGRFRPRNNGYYGRFKVVSIRWSNGDGHAHQ